MSGDPVALASAMVARYEAELAAAPAETEAQIAHRGVLALLIADWKARAERILANALGSR